MSSTGPNSFWVLLKIEPKVDEFNLIFPTPTPKVNVNGLACKDAKDVTADDFFFSGFHKAGNTSNALGSRVTPVFADQLPGLNTLGISLARIDYAPDGLNPPHLHPRAPEVLVVLKGTLEVGFVTSLPELKLFTKVLKKGDVFVFPLGLVHFQRNVGSTYAIALAGLSSQTPGAIPVAATLFASQPATQKKHSKSMLLLLVRFGQSSKRSRHKKRHDDNIVVNYMIW